MGLFRTSGSNHIRRQKTSADIPVIDQTPQVYKNKDNILQIANDLYSSPSLDGDTLPNLTAALETLAPPIGSIVPHYDFNGAITPPANWLYCDGSVISDSESPLDGQTLPDTSGRYLVGFGTDGGGDVDSAAWATPAVGNAGHQLSLAAHTHDVNIASFTSGSESSHTHGAGSLRFKWMTYHNAASKGDSDRIFNWTSGGSQVENHLIREIVEDFSTNIDICAGYGSAMQLSGTGGEEISSWTQNNTGLGNTDPGSSHSHSVNPPNTESAGHNGATQDIQPRSIRVRHIMRIK